MAFAIRWTGTRPLMIAAAAALIFGAGLFGWKDARAQGYAGRDRDRREAPGEPREGRYGYGAPRSYPAPDNRYRAYGSPGFKPPPYAPPNYGRPSFAPPPRYAPEMAPPRRSSQAAWRRGQHLPLDSRGEMLGDYARYHLRRPPRGFFWYREGDDFVLAAYETGLIFDVISAGGY